MKTQSDSKRYIFKKISCSIIALLMVLTSISTITGIITPANAVNDCIPPSADANGPYYEVVGTSLSLDGSASSDADGDIVFYEWDFDGDGTYDWSSTTESNTAHTYNTAGVYTATLRVTDNDDCNDTDTANVFISEENPELSASCGIDICLVLDVSGSISSGELSTMKNAFVGFVDAFLPRTPTMMSVVQFGTTASIIQPFTSNITALKSAINGASGGGCTNWEGALMKANDTFDPRMDKPDLIVFASDGNPNTIFGGPGCQYTDGHPIPVGHAVQVANEIKSQGIRIISLGIGDSLDAENLIAISSSDAYISSNFDQLANDLANLSAELCGGTVTVRKFVDGFPAVDWEFTASVTGGTSTPTSGFTGPDGYIVFDIEMDGGVETAYVNITETPQSGFNFVNAVAYDCADNPVGVQGINSVNCIPVATNCAIYAEFNNTEQTDDIPPEQIFEIGNPNITRIWRENLYYVVGPCTPISITSIDDDSGSDRIEYSVWVAEDLNADTISWVELEEYHSIVYDEDDGKDDGITHVEFYLNEKCLHEIRYQCWDEAGNTEGLFSVDLFVDKCTPKVIKQVGCPQYGVGVIQPPWATMATPLEFSTYDRCCLPNGTAVKSLTIKVWWKPTTCNDTGAMNVISTIYVEDGCSADTDLREGYVGYTYHFPLSGWYELEYWAEDIMCNTGAHTKQQHRVDVEPPEIIKTHPDHGYMRINDTFGYLKAGEEITLEAYDMPDDTCNVGLQGLYWRYEWNGTMYPQPGDPDAIDGATILVPYCVSNPDVENYWWYEYTTPITFMEECRHDLFYFAKDHIGNHEHHHQVYYVDDTEPYMEVEYPGHGYYTGDEDHLKINTPITLNAYDNPDNLCQADIESIFWRYDYDDDHYPLDDDTGIVHGIQLVADYGQDYNISEITDYYWYREDSATVDVAFQEECMHDLYFFTKDNVCHPSEIYNLRFYVDGTEPQLYYAYPEHGYYIEELDQSGASPILKPHLKCNTPFTISAADKPFNECAAGIESIFWRYEWNDTLFPNAAGPGSIHGSDLVTDYGSDYNIPAITDYYWYRVDSDAVEIMFTEECYHKLYWFAKDNVCQRTDLAYNPYYVDNTSPEINVEFDEDAHGYYQDDLLRDHIKCGTQFKLDAYDLPDTECMAGIESIFWRYDYENISYPEEADPGCNFINGMDLVELYGEDYNISAITDYVWYRVDDDEMYIHFNEECQHNVWYFAKDNVCHRSDLKMIDIYVDCSEPDVWLDLPGHGYYPINDESGYLKAGSATFTINASDNPDNDCAVGIESIFWRYEYGGQEYPMGPDIGVVSGDYLAAQYGYTDPNITENWWYFNNSTQVSVAFPFACQHDVYYWAKDNVCHRTDVKKHTFFVDDMPPVVYDLPPQVTHGFYETDTSKYLKCGLPIHISAYDEPEDTPCAAGIESIFWRYEFNGDSYPDEGEETAIDGSILVGLYGDAYDVPEITDNYWYRVDDNTVNVIFDEECNHTLIYFAKDNVCQRTDIYDSTWYIDCTGPDTWFEYDGDHGYIPITPDSSYIKAGESIDIYAEDLPENDCASGIESIFWRYEFEDDSYPQEDAQFAINGTQLAAQYGYTEPEILDHWWYRVDDDMATAAFNEECQHDLYYFAKDNVSNHGSINEHTFYVDEYPPQISKEHPTDGYVYLNEQNYIGCGTPIWINATDDGMCDAGVESLFWRYEFNGTQYPTEPGTDIVSGEELFEMYGSDYENPDIYEYLWYRINADTATVIFDENCIHDLYYFGKDNVCHPTMVHHQRYYVDCTPPESWKEVDDPYCVATEDDIAELELADHEIPYFWIRDNDTWITINAEDKEDPCAVGIDYLHVELWWDENNNNVFDAEEMLWSHNVDGTSYEFQIYEDCLHKVVWYAVDMLGNAEQPHEQRHRVDSQPPVSVKTFNGSTYPAEDYPNEMYGPDMGEHYWVTSDTQITLTALDQADPCAVGVTGFFVKVEWDWDCDGDYDVTLYDGAIDDPYSISFTFKQLVDTYYQFEYECYEGSYRITWSSFDCLGNIEEETIQYHRVDDTPPHVVVLKPTDGWYADGECIPAVVFSEDITSPHCGYEQCGTVGIEDGKPGYAYLIDIFPEFGIVELDTTNFLYDADSHEFIGNVCIPEESGITDGITLFVAGAEDNLGNDWDSIREMIHAIVIQALAESDSESGCMELISDLWADFVMDQNLVFIGIDNTPPEVEIIETNVELGTIHVKVNATDVLSGIVSGTPCYFTLGGVDIGSLPYDSTMGGCEGTLPTAGAPDGEQTLTVCVSDRAGSTGCDSAIVDLIPLPGPTTSGTDVTPASSIVGTELTVTATVHSTIAEVVSAEYYINIKGEDGNGTPLTTVDGVWDGTMEDITATIDTTGWQPGEYTIYVHGLDNHGRWGAYDEEEFTLVHEQQWRPVVINIMNPLDGETFDSTEDRYVTVIVDAYRPAYGGLPMDHDLNVSIWLDQPYGAPDLYYPVTWDGTYFTTEIPIYIYQSGKQLDLQARAEDEYWNRAEDSVSFIVDTTIIYDQWMYEGWNSLTLPQQGIACGHTITEVLASIDGHYDAVYWYNPTTRVWEFNILGIGGGLTTMKTGEEYWVHMINKTRYYTDTMPPYVEITWPAGEEDLILNTLDEISGVAYDIETGVQKVELQIMYTEADTTYYWDDGTMTWTTTPTWLTTNLDMVNYIQQWEYNSSEIIFTCGINYTIVAKATDKAGCSMIDESTFLWDDCPPLVEIIDPEDGQERLEGPDTIDFTAEDMESWITETYLEIHDDTTDEYYNGAMWQGTQTWLTPTYDTGNVYYYTSTGIWGNRTDHTFSITAQAYDYPGNMGYDMNTFTIVSPSGECDPDHTWTTTSDFEEGTINGLDSSGDQLELILGETTSYPTLWVANAGEDSLSKWDTQENKELARYHTWFGPLADHGAWTGPAPSRTCVDADGNCYVANRHFDTSDPDVIKVYTDDWVDRNGNGVLDTSYDANNDGKIQESEMLPMTDDNSNGIIDPEEIIDERIAWATHVDGDGYGRSLAIDLEGYIWLGCYGAHTYYKLDPDTGAVLAGPYSVGSHTPYGALVDKYGYLWGSSLSSNILKMNTSDPSDYTTYSVPSTYGIALSYDSLGNTLVYCGGNYPYVVFNSSTETYSSPVDSFDYTRGIAVDSQGDITFGSASDGTVAKYSPDGVTIWEVAGQVISEVRGIVVDSDDNIWAIHRDESKLCKYDGTDGTHLGVFDAGLHPYTYSDATGLGFASSVASGTWDVIYDSGAADTQWNKVTWNADVPTDTNLAVKIRSSNDGAAWSPYEDATNGGTLTSTPNGRYISIKVTMKSTSPDNAPILYDLTLDGTCAAGEPEPVCIEYSACHDGSDWITIEDCKLSIQHRDHNPIGSAGDCPGEYHGIIMIDGVAHEVMPAGEGMYPYLIDGQPFIYVPIQSINMFTKTDGRGNVTGDDPNTILVDDDEYSSADIYNITICGPACDAETYSIAGEVYYDGELEDEILNVVVFDEWPLDLGDPDLVDHIVNHKLFLYPEFPQHYEIPVAPGDLYVGAGLFPMGGSTDPLAFGFALNKTYEEGADMITIIDSDVPGQDVTLEPWQVNSTPVVEIDNPTNGMEFAPSENPGFTINGTAYDVDTYVDNVIVAMYYSDGDETYYYNTSSFSWQDESYYTETMGTGAGTPGDPYIWSLHTEPAFPDVDGHIYVKAIAYDHDTPMLLDEDTNWFALVEPCEADVTIFYPNDESIDGDVFLEIQGMVENTCECPEIEDITIAVYYTPYENTIDYPTYYWNASSGVWEGSTIIYNPVDYIAGGCPDNWIEWTLGIPPSFYREGATTYNIYVAPTPEAQAGGVAQSQFTVGIPDYEFVGYWKFDEGTGTVAADSSGQSGAGTLYGGPNWTTGKRGNCLEFDQSGEYVQLFNSLGVAFEADYTWMAWIKGPSEPTSSNEHKIMGRLPFDSGEAIQLHTGHGSYGYPNNLYHNIWGQGSDFRSSTDVRDNQWHFVVAVNTGSQVKIYVDDGPAEATSGPGYSGALASSHNISIGSFMGSQVFNGLIDEVAIFDHALTEAEIQQCYNNILAGIDYMGVD